MIEWHKTSEENPTRESPLLVIVKGELFFARSFDVDWYIGFVEFIRFYDLDLKNQKDTKKHRWYGPELTPEPTHWAYINPPEGEKE